MNSNPIDVKEIREEFNKWQVTEPTSQELSTLRADNYDFSFVTFYAGYQAALSAFDHEAIKRACADACCTECEQETALCGGTKSAPRRPDHCKIRAAILQSSPVKQGPAK